MSFSERRRFLWILFLTGAAITLLFAVVVRGTTFSHLSFDELAHQATVVARLRCISADTLWNSGELWTETKFEIIESAKGHFGNLITVRTLGGTIGSFHSHVDGVPVFHQGEEVYLFLWGREGEPFRVLGWSQGTFRIYRDERTGTEKVTQDSAAIAIYHPETREFRREGIKNLPIANFQAKLRQALQQ